jgi:hypothetical protein
VKIVGSRQWAVKFDLFSSPGVTTSAMNIFCENAARVWQSGQHFHVKVVRTRMKRGIDAV